MTRRAHDGFVMAAFLAPPGCLFGKPVPYSSPAVPFILIRGYRFGVRTREPRFEPMHVHVLGRSGEAKFWLRPVRLEMSTYNRAVTKQIQRIVRQHERTFVGMWEEIHGHD